MTTIAAGRLSETLQALVDARLDTIDRMLLGRVNRHDRLAIVREVETQIFDLLQGRDSDSIDRDDVLAVLARLDPPEAYLSVEGTGEASPMRLPTTPRPIRPSAALPSPLPKTSGILGIISVLLGVIPLLIVAAAASNPQVPATSFVIFVFFGSVGVIFILSLLAVTLAGCARLRGHWALIGLVTGTIMLLASIVGAMSA